MIYLPDTSLITHIISYNNVLTIYHMSAQEPHLSNILLNMAQMSTHPELVWQEGLLHGEHISLQEVEQSSYLPAAPSSPGGNKIRCKFVFFWSHSQKRRIKHLYMLTRRSRTTVSVKEKSRSGSSTKITHAWRFKSSKKKGCKLKYWGGLKSMMKVLTIWRAAAQHQAVTILPSVSCVVNEIVFVINVAITRLNWIVSLI